MLTTQSERDEENASYFLLFSCHDLRRSTRQAEQVYKYGHLRINGNRCVTKDSHRERAKSSSAATQVGAAAVMTVQPALSNFVFHSEANASTAGASRQS